MKLKDLDENTDVNKKIKIVSYPDDSSCGEKYYMQSYLADWLGISEEDFLDGVYTVYDIDEGQISCEYKGLRGLVLSPETVIRFVGDEVDTEKQITKKPEFIWDDGKKMYVINK